MNNFQSLDWTEARVEQLKTMWAEGHSCSVIAKAIGYPCTRNSVIGKVWRLGLPKRATVARKVRVSHIRERSTVLKIVGPVVHSKPLPKETPAPATARRIPLAELTSTTCRWPMGDPKGADFGFCGCETSESATYCPYHAHVSASRWQDRYSNVLDEILKEAA